jgi:hypothetical protein
MGARMARVMAVLLAAVIVGPMKAYGTSYDPLPHGEEGTAATAMAPGATVYLFHSGTEEVRRSMRVGDVLVVSRPGEYGTSRTVGKIQVAAPAGAFCLRGEVLDGSIHLQDLASREGVYCLVVPEVVCGR